MTELKIIEDTIDEMIEPIAIRRQKTVEIIKKSKSGSIERTVLEGHFGILNDLLSEMRVSIKLGLYQLIIDRIKEINRDIVNAVKRYNFLIKEIDRIQKDLPSQAFFYSREKEDILRTLDKMSGSKSELIRLGNIAEEEDLNKINEVSYS